jgi:hypothetical protein
MRDGTPISHSCPEFAQIVIGDNSSEGSVDDTPRTEMVGMNPLIVPPSQLLGNSSPLTAYESVPSSELHSLEFILGKANTASDLKMVLQGGQDVGVFLDEDDSFFVDLPFLEAVLPSMAFGEQLFAPLYIQKILLPTWYGRRSAHNTKNFQLEQQIITIARQHFYPALSNYLRLLYFARLLSIEVLLKDKPVLPKNLTIQENPHTIYLASFIEEFVGVDLLDSASPFTIHSAIKTFIRGNEDKIVPIVMIGHQWGFDVRIIAQNIIDVMSFYQVTEDRRLMAIASDARMPALNPATVASVHWTMSPSFEFLQGIDSDAEGGHYRLVPKMNYSTAAGPSDMPERRLSEEEKTAKLIDIITQLQDREAYVAPGRWQRCHVEDSYSLNS